MVTRARQNHHKMAASMITVLLAILVAFTNVICEETHDLPSTSGFPSIPGLSSIPGFSGFPTFPSIPNFPGIPNFRGQRQVPASDSKNEESIRQGRFFFHFLPTSVSCNYTTENGRSCRSCNQALTCFSNNSGFIHRCHGFLPYCNAGSCSFFPGSDCDPAPTTESTSTTASTTTTTAATGR